MGKTVLFSPIGGTDPIATATGYDGSMLHICRHYLPDKVYLFLSSEMIERHERDDRYRWCIKKLGEIKNHTFDIECLNEYDFNEVQEYDEAYRRFRPIIHGILDSMDDGDKFIVNVASGTPAMKSALLMLAVMSEGRIMPIQVVTPEKSINMHPGKKDGEYNCEDCWDNDMDNTEGEPNRCREVDCPSLTAILKRNIIVRQLRNYNYAAALELGCEIKDYITERSYKMLELALERQQLNLSKVTAISKEYDFDVIPVKDGSKVLMFEYALSLNIKIQRKEYGDFLRSISPLLADVYESILKRQCDIDMDDYCYRRKSDGARILAVNRLQNAQKGKEINEVLNEQFKRSGGYSDRELSARNMHPILMKYLSDDKIKSCVDDLNNIESRLRNLAAHEIVSMTDEYISQITQAATGKSMNASQIYSEIKVLVVAAGINVKKDEWHSYDRMNKAIEHELSTPLPTKI